MITRFLSIQHIGYDKNTYLMHRFIAYLMHRFIAEDQIATEDLSR